jgi:hypothetical protein
MLGNHPKECCKLSFVSFSKLLCAVAWLGSVFYGYKINSKEVNLSGPFICLSKWQTNRFSLDLWIVRLSLVLAQVVICLTPGLSPTDDVMCLKLTFWTEYLQVLAMNYIKKLQLMVMYGVCWVHNRTVTCFLLLFSELIFSKREATACVYCVHIFWTLHEFTVSL